MRVTYKHQEPEIVIQPNVYAMFSYIANNVKTNLVWVCLVRKLGVKYIIEDLYFPPQNVNEWVMCNFSEEYVSRITNSEFNADYRVCKFNMIGRFTIGKSTTIDAEAIKFFEKSASVSLDECLMMQLNNKLEMEFGVNRRATILTELPYSIDMSNLIDVADFKRILDSKIGSYSFVNDKDKETTTSETMKKVPAKNKDKKEIKSVLLGESVHWKSIL